jgi:hypothetical protein
LPPAAFPKNGSPSETLLELSRASTRARIPCKLSRERYLRQVEVLTRRKARFRFASRSGARVRLSSNFFRAKLLTGLLGSSRA